MRRGWIIAVLVLLLLSLLANGGLLWTYGNIVPEVQRLQQDVARQSQELDRLRPDRDGLAEQVQTLQQEKQRLEEENARLQQELSALQSRGSLLEQLDRLEAEVRALRRQVPPETVPRAYVSAEELLDRRQERFSAAHSSEQAVTEAQVLELLGLLEPGTDIYQLLLDLSSPQAATFYDVGDGRLYVGQTSELGPQERASFVREYLDALQDQVLDLGAQAEAVADDADRSLALQALAQGDAALAMEQYAREHPDIASVVAALSGTVGLDLAGLEAAPPAVRAELLFPYQAGLDLVRPLHTARGWAGVDSAWADPPQSTEQVLHPDRYPSDRPVLVSLPALGSTLGPGWRLLGENTLGEFRLRQHLALYLEADQVDEAATGWGGDRYALYVHTNRRVACLVVRLVWDSLAEAREFAEIYPAYAEQRYGAAGEGEAVEGMWWDGQPGLYLQRSGDEIWLIMAPSREEAEEVARKLR